MLASIKAWIYGAIVGALGLLGVMLYRKGSDDATTDAKLEDYENAEKLRRDAAADYDERLRKLSDRGWRD